MKAFGELCVRLVLRVLKKEKWGREPQGWESTKAICEAFAKELTLKKDAKCPPSKEKSKVTEIDLDVKDVLKSKPAEIAFLQNPHMQKNAQLLVQIKLCLQKVGVKHCVFVFVCCKVCMHQTTWEQSVDIGGHN